MITTKTVNNHLYKNKSGFELKPLFYFQKLKIILS